MKKEITLYYTSDTHGNVFPSQHDVSFYSEGEEFHACAMYCFHEFEKNGNTLLLDGGDTIQGSPFTRFLWKEKIFEQHFPNIFNVGNYDYYTLGNHDFNYGYEGLSSYVRNMKGKCIIANVVDKTGAMEFEPYVIHVTQSGLKVGIVGLVTDAVNLLESENNLKNFEVSDSFEKAKEVLEEIKDLCDVTVCIYHGGFEEDLNTGKRLTLGNENRACEICQELEYDILLSAHQHMEQKGRMYYGTYILQLPPYAMKYAKIHIEKDDTNAENRLQIQSELVTPKAIMKEGIMTQFEDILEKSENWLSRRAGSLKEAVYPQEENVKQALSGGIVDLSNLVTKEHLKCDIACASLSKQKSYLPKELTIENILRAFPFANLMLMKKMKGHVLLKGLERSATYFDYRYNQLVVSELFIKPKEEHYHYDYFAGVTYDVSAGQPFGQRVSNVLVNGQPLDLEKEYTIGMTDYRATGTGGYDFYADCEVVGVSTTDIQELVLDYLHHHENLDLPRLSQVNIIDYEEDEEDEDDLLR